MKTLVTLVEKSALFLHRATWQSSAIPMSALWVGDSTTTSLAPKPSTILSFRAPKTKFIRYRDAFKCLSYRISSHHLSCIKDDLHQGWPHGCHGPRNTPRALRDRTERVSHRAPAKWLRQKQLALPTWIETFDLQVSWKQIKWNQAWSVICWNLLWRQQVWERIAKDSNQPLWLIFLPKIGETQNQHKPFRCFNTQMPFNLAIDLHLTKVLLYSTS